MSRGRPRGSVKAERRLRRDYRFSPTTLQIIEQGRQRAAMSETAFVEAAIQHYHEFLVRGEAESHELEQLRARARRLEEELVEVSRPRPAPTIERQLPPPLPVAATSLSSSRQPVYQIYLRHAPGVCPDLPEGFDYIDGDRSKGNRRCMNPTHRVFTQPCTVASARRRAEQLQEVAGVVHIWIADRKGDTLSRDSWRKENGRWVKSD